MELLQILVCPEDRTPLTEAGEDLVAKINAAVEKGVLKNREGKLVTLRTTTYKYKYKRVKGGKYKRTVIKVKVAVRVSCAKQCVKVVKKKGKYQSIYTIKKVKVKIKKRGRIVTVNYSSLTGDIRALAHRLAAVVEQVTEETGYERVHIVGHSMGGLIARYYVQRLDGDARVHTLVTLGTPHQGTNLAYTLPHPLVRQLRPGSDVVRELEEPAPGCRTRMVAVWSDLDQLLSPKQSAKIEHADLQARNVFFRGIGHMSLPVDGRVVHEICTTLAHLDTDGQTLAAGATSIASSTGRTAASRPPQDPATGLARGRSRR